MKNSITLPNQVEEILIEYNSPEILKRHLYLVFNTAEKIINELNVKWGDLSFNKEEVLFGACTHDIGKVIETNELYEPGKRHEEIGENILIKKGIDKKFARFAKSHGSVLYEHLLLEDLLVILADKIWKGKRVMELEQEISKHISKQIHLDYWNIFMELDIIISDIVIGADDRIQY